MIIKLIPTNEFQREQTTELEINNNSKNYKAKLLKRVYFFCCPKISEKTSDLPNVTPV